MYYQECSYCGAHLDPGESCDCSGAEWEAADEEYNRRREDDMEVDSPIIKEVGA